MELIMWFPVVLLALLVLAMVITPFETWRRMRKLENVWAKRRLIFLAFAYECGMLIALVIPAIGSVVKLHSIMPAIIPVVRWMVLNPGFAALPFVLAVAAAWLGLCCDQMASGNFKKFWLY